MAIRILTNFKTNGLCLMHVTLLYHEVTSDFMLVHVAIGEVGVILILLNTPL